VSIWNINSFAEYFMQIYSKYEGDYKKACEKFLAERCIFEKGLREIPFLRVIPSQANYFLCEVLQPYNARGIVISMLKKYNILMRDCSDKIGLGGKQYLRIAVRGHHDNQKLINALKSIY
jgi:histidinol-phosphate/aromatic aminotransferase/cobyric acid decarboxylase-like protein